MVGLIAIKSNIVEIAQFSKPGVNFFESKKCPIEFILSDYLFSPFRPLSRLVFLVDQDVDQTIYSLTFIVIYLIHLIFN